LDKRQFIKSVLIGSAGLVATTRFNGLQAARSKKRWNGVFTLPELPYAYDALEPFIDAKTMEIHHGKHHAAYTNNFNTAVAEAGLTGKSAREILAEVSKYKPAIRNNGGGYFNHKLFWKMLAPPSAMKPSDLLSSAINKDFGSYDSFREKFSGAAKSVFGSGWAWLILADGTLKITTTANQDNSIMDVVPDKGHPLLCLDVWEHAYYLKYQNRRADYIDAFWNVVNWDFVSRRFEKQSTE